MTKWEYKTVPIPPHIAAEVMNTWGDDGWELVCVFSPPEVGGTIAGVGQRLLDNTCTQRTGRHEEDGC